MKTAAENLRTGDRCKLFKDALIVYTFKWKADNRIVFNEGIEVDLNTTVYKIS